MALDLLQKKVPTWLDEVAGESGAALFCQTTLARNLADFPFPARCSDDERAAVVDRVLSALDGLNLLNTGEYFALERLNPWEIRFLAERRWITHDMIAAHGPRGVYVSNDQQLCIMVNSADHLCLRAFRPGLHLDEAWAQLNLLDDTLSGMLDFAFNSRLGYLTAALSMLGCALKASVLLHLPGLTLTNALGDSADTVKAKHLELRGIVAGNSFEYAESSARRKPGPVADEGAQEAGLDQALFSDLDGALPCPIQETLGDLFLLVNHATLGASEEELVYHVRRMAEELAEKESESRDALRHQSRDSLEDRVGRACGIASGSRLLSFPEGLALLSAIRLGVATGTVDGLDLAALNKLYFVGQAAHLEAGRRHSCEALLLNRDRAALFRRIVSGATVL